MELLLDVYWFSLLAACLASDSPSSSPDPSATAPPSSLVLPRGPRLLRCVFQQRANITCYWEPGEMNQQTITKYTLRIQKMKNQTIFKCSTAYTSCTAQISPSSVAFTFCIQVTAHTPSADVSSETRCQSGREEVMLSPVPLETAEPVGGAPHCLVLRWSLPFTSVVSVEEIKEGKLFSQIEHTSPFQPHPQVSDIIGRECNNTGCYLTACVFSPDTVYTVRLRHRFKSYTSPWSPWSNPCQGRTGEDAPSAAPAFWRQVTPTGSHGWRHVTLLWKALSHSEANGRVLSYNVRCKRETGLELVDHETCHGLHPTRTSCSLLVPPESCVCSLTASNAAGTSPAAYVWLQSVSETEPPPPGKITVTPLDDFTLNVQWTAPLDQSVSAFVVEWSAVTEAQNSTLHWARLNSSCTSVVISEGVEPMVCYTISVRGLYKERGAGWAQTTHAYTRQGAPSAGPKLTVQRIHDGVLLHWRPIPVEYQRGYIRNYTLHFTHTTGHRKNVCVPGSALQYSLHNLLPGDYAIYMQGNTDAGAGKAGLTAIVNIGNDHILLMYVLKCTIIPFIVVLLTLILVVYLGQKKILREKLCQNIPDPSYSSLAHWTPNAFKENLKSLPITQKPNIQFSVVVVDSETEHQDSYPVPVFSYSIVPRPSMYTIPANSPDTCCLVPQALPIVNTTYEQHTREPATPCHNGNSRTSEENSPDTTDRTDTTTFPYPCSYAQFLCSQPLQGLFQDIQGTSMLTVEQYMPFGVNNNSLQQGGESELCTNG